MDLCHAPLDMAQVHLVSLHCWQHKASTGITTGLEGSSCSLSMLLSTQLWTTAVVQCWGRSTPASPMLSVLHAPSWGAGHDNTSGSGCMSWGCPA